jgi:hypothetical protein
MLPPVGTFNLDFVPSTGTFCQCFQFVIDDDRWGAQCKDDQGAAELPFTTHIKCLPNLGVIYMMCLHCMPQNRQHLKINYWKDSALFCATTPHIFKPYPKKNQIFQGSCGT